MDKATARPLRTVLFVPGDQVDQVHAARGSGADSIVIDLEEPRTPFPESARETARAGIRAFFDTVSPGDDGPLLFARVQPPSSGQTIKDLRAVMSPALTGVLVPKVQGPGDIHAMHALLHNMEVDLGVPVGTVAIYPILETAQALRQAYEIGVASPRVAYLGGAVSRFGDIHQALGYRWTPEGRETLFLRSKVLVDARAAGIRYPVSGMWGGARDDVEGLRRWAEELRDLGYYGMMLGDPVHIPIVHEVFTPTPAEIGYWQDLDRLARDAETSGEGPITYGDAGQGEGHVVHIAHVGSARLNLQWARDLGVVP
ncbi:MAG TPA: aldolase/citrate lyase family protein [Acidimicrobiia bacterium]|nr:aldolase/citrate lyase family protein [Acidimicrobiia bacterium]